MRWIPLWTTLKAKLRGHYAYYGVSGNTFGIRRYAAIARKLIRKWLNRRSQRRKMTWERFNRYLTYYPLPRPKITYKIYAFA